MRKLPRQLTEDELAELFESRTALVRKLGGLEDPLAGAERAIAELSEEEKLEALDAHPRIGARTLSARSAAEQGAADPSVEAELEELNHAYENRFGFRFVVFVDRRPRAELVAVLRERLERSRDEELDTALHELVAIARDRWSRG
ncbi:MAG TPA: 2-oxo-4-hydroxy-4-carboxy-5-ureidoimidazoline decarboxylase [Gaiellaceae bacterium]|nr:2-oxo-4-hydroxy-4-carboxy-5-ureidoimidazoline decarboxylase [Gaiellaceae bacterium]